MSTPKLFQPIQIGNIQLAHRVVFAPVTRFRADENHTPLPHVEDYYEQRASTPGSFLVSEATLIAERAAKHAPGIWSDEHIAAWKRGLCSVAATIRVTYLFFVTKIMDKVHAKESFMYLQLWAPGRVGSNFPDPADV
ncbi:hypothetical protein B0H14DRAFT_2863505, partial [Mycena olivaceomarginata]